MDEWIDITLKLKNGLPPWPGDMPFTRTVASKIGEEGSVSEVSVLSMSAHSGTHVDAPRHFIAGGGDVAGLAPALLIGRAYVLEAPSGTEHVSAEELGGRVPGGCVRLLIKTGNAQFGEIGAFREDFRALQAGAAAMLAGLGVRLLGIDAPSIAPYDAPEGAHRAFFEAGGLAALENVDLAGVSEGWYELVCLPLPVINGDGSPARALLRRMEAVPDEAS